MDAYRSLKTSSYQRANSTNNTNADPNRFDDLLIFGYACKLFRDDEKALHIDQGKHLMPWMGDSTLKIDRLIHFYSKHLQLFLFCNLFLEPFFRGGLI